MKILGVSLGHDTNFCLVQDRKIVGIKEAERYFRQKRYKLHALSLEKGKRPSGYQYVDVSELETFLEGIAKAWGRNYDAIAVQNQGREDEAKNLETLMRRMGFEFKTFQSVDHHLSHAALAWYTSPYPEALVLSFDGLGNDGCTVFFEAKGGQGLKYLERNDTHFGQGYNNVGYIARVKPDISGSTAGKTMGLGSYGDVRADWMPAAREYVRNYRKAPGRKVEGDLVSYGAGHRINSVGLDQIPEFKPYLVEAKRDDAPKGGFFDFLKKPLATDVPTHELLLPGPEDKLTQDMLKTVQAAWTEEVLALLAKHKHVSRNLCVVGGCALNGVTNYAIEESRMFDSVHFIPNPTDCGLSAGAALYLAHDRGQAPFNGYGTYFSPYLGDEPFDLDELPKLKQQYPHRELTLDQTPKVLARLIHSDKIVGVVHGRYEVGPRALGNRSILCNPLNRNMRDIINQKVKHREWYRPFAPVVAAEDSHKYFTNIQEIPYMSVICFTRPEYREQLPSITHVDGTARVQTIHRENHPFLHSTLKEFEKLSGMPIILNTSFNPRGEPILNFCSVALQMLKDTDLDYVLINDTLFCKPGNEALLQNLT